MSSASDRWQEGSAEIPSDLMAMLPAPGFCATIRIMPHRVGMLVSSTFARAGFQQTALRQRDRMRGTAMATKIVTMGPQAPQPDLDLFEQVQNVCEVSVAWQGVAEGRFDIAWVIHFPQGFRPAPLKRNAAELLAYAWKDVPFPQVLQLLYKLGFTQNQVFQMPPPGQSLEEKNRQLSIRQALVHYTKAEENAARARPRVEQESNVEFGRVLLAEAALEPPLPPAGSYVLGPGESLDLDRLTLVGAMEGDYSGCATQAEVADLASGVLPLGRWAFGRTDAVQYGRQLYLSPENLAFQGALIVAPSGRGKTHLLKRWAQAANAAGYSVLIVDVKGDMYQELSERLYGDIGYFATDRTILPGVSEPGKERTDRLNLLGGLDWKDAPHRDDIISIADVLLPARGWKGEGGQVERAFRARRALLKNLILIALMRSYYKEDSWQGRPPDLGDIFEMAADESLLVASAADVQAGEAQAVAGGEPPAYSIASLIREIKYMVSPPPRGPDWGTRAPDQSYADHTFGVVDALRSFGPGTTFYEKIRSQGPGKLFDVDALARPEQVTLILAARGQDGEPADAVLSFTIKRAEQILLNRFKDTQARPVLLLLDETVRIREFDPLNFISISRQARTATVLVYQGVAKIPGDQRQDLLTTIGIQIYLGDVPHPMVELVQQGLPTRKPTPHLSPNANPHGAPIPIYGREPVPALGPLELEQLKSGKRSAIVYIRDHPSGKPIPVSLYEQAPKTLRVFTEEHQTFDEVIRQAEPGARILIPSGKHYVGTLTLSNSVELCAASAGKVELDGTIYIKSIRDGELFPPLIVRLCNLTVKKVELLAPATVECISCDIDTINAEASNSRIAAHNSEIGWAYVDMYAGSLDLIDCRIGRITMQEIERAVLTRCEVRQSNFERLFQEYSDDHAKPYAVDSESRPPYPARIHACACQFWGCETTDVELTGVDCVFSPRVLQLTDGWADERHTAALEISYDTKLTLTGGRVEGLIRGRYSSLTARGTSLGEPVRWPGGIPAVGFEDFAGVLDLGNTPEPTRLENCSIRLRGLDAAQTFAKVLAEDQIQLTACRVTIPYLPPGAVPLKIPGAQYAADFSAFATEEEAGPLGQGIFPLGHWAFHEVSGNPRSGRRLYLQPVPLTTMVLPKTSEEEFGAAHLPGYWVEAANAAGWSVVVLAGRKALPGPTLRLSGPSWGISLPAAESGSLRSTLVGLDLLRGLGVETPRRADRIARSVALIDSLQSPASPCVDSQRTAMALAMLALHSYENDADFWRGKHPDFGDVYDIATSATRLKTVRSAAGPLSDPSWNAVLDGFEADPGEIRSYLIRMLQPFVPDDASRASRWLGLTPPSFPLWALTIAQPATLLIDFDSEAPSHPEALLALRLLAGVLAERAAAVPDQPLLLLMDGLPGVTSADLRSIVKISKTSRTCLAFVVADLNSVQNDVRRELLASTNALLEVGTPIAKHQATLRLQGMVPGKPVLLDLQDPEPVIAPGETATVGRDYSGLATAGEVADLSAGTMPVGHWAFDGQRGPLLHLPPQLRSMLVVSPDLGDASSYLGHWVRTAIGRNRDPEERRNQSWSAVVFGSSELVAALPFGGIYSDDRLLLPRGAEPQIPAGALKDLNPVPSELTLETAENSEIQWVTKISATLAPVGPVQKVLSALILLAACVNHRSQFWHFDGPTLGTILQMIEDPELLQRVLQKAMEMEPQKATQYISELPTLDAPDGVVKRQLIKTLGPFRGSRFFGNVVNLVYLTSTWSWPNSRVFITTPGDPAAQATALVVARLLGVVLDQRDKNSAPLLFLLELGDALRAFDLRELLEVVSRSRTLLVLVARDLASVPPDLRPLLLSNVQAWLHIGSLPPAHAAVLAEAGQLDGPSGLEKFGSLPVGGVPGLLRLTQQAGGKPILLDLDWGSREMRQAEQNPPGSFV